MGSKRQPRSKFIEHRHWEIEVLGWGEQIERAFRRRVASQTSLRLRPQTTAEEGVQKRSEQAPLAA